MKTLSIFLLLAATVLAQKPPAAPPKADEVVAWAKTAYSIEIVTEGMKLPVKGEGWEMTAAPASKPDIERCLELVRSELALYPKELWARSKTKKIVLVSGIAVSGQSRYAMPDFHGGALYFDTTIFKEPLDYRRRVFHHEYFHLIDFADDGSVYADSKWSKLNPSDFKYGSGGRFMREAAAGTITKDLPGFVSRYATSGVEEDKAEIFGLMMMNPAFVADREKNDPILAKKFGRLRKSLEGFCKQMNDAHWKRVAEAPINVAAETRPAEVPK